MADVFSPPLNCIVKLPAKHSGLADGYDPGMLDIYGIRKANLLAISADLRQRHPEWREQDVALALNLSPSYYSQLKGDKVMGDDVARKIETAVALPTAWMDNAHEPAGLSVRESAATYGSHSLRIDPETISAALKLVRLAFRQRDQEIDQEENGEPLAFAYEFLMTRKENTVTAENVVEFSRAIYRRQPGGADEVQARDDRSVGGSDRQHNTGRKAG